ncbi:MAG: SDR family NAD(P)-dependent oxidoreductase [Rhodobacteraceae bacterium]|jgi:short-subunit dehydrogenase|nr:SDR family NAD(P)-dependent oxidoreductase [Paracoccaceae bacterium]
MGWVLITGASEGLGREFAQLAAADGHMLILSARRTELLEAVAADLSGRFGVEALVLPADLSVEGEAEKLWARAVAGGREISILVNNAGLAAGGGFADPALWAREYASVMVNVLSATVLMKAAAVEMAQRGQGRILNVASAAAFMPGPGMAVYHATKAYLLSLSEAAAAELAPAGVTVTALCPGATRTDFFRAGGFADETLIQRLPMPTAQSVAAAGWTAMKRGRRITVTGIDNRIFAFLPRLVPRRLVTFVAGQFLRRR